jgi:hypothetical protein
MTRFWPVSCLTGLIALGGTAQGQTRPEMVFEASAQIGPQNRPVRFHFFCSENEGPNLTGVLSVELETTRYEELREQFDFTPFEGPDADAGALSSLQVNGPRAKASDRFAAAGSATPTDGADSFTLEVTASRREAGPLRKLATVLRPLIDGPGRVIWRQAAANRGGVPLIATLDVTQARSDELKSGLARCLATR